MTARPSPRRLRRFRNHLDVFGLGTAFARVALFALRDAAGMHLHAFRARLVRDAAAILARGSVREFHEARNDDRPADAPWLLHLLLVRRNARIRKNLYRRIDDV